MTGDAVLRQLSLTRTPSSDGYQLLQSLPLTSSSWKFLTGVSRDGEGGEGKSAEPKADEAF